MSHHQSAVKCDYVSIDCPVEASVYGYYPNLGANTFFAVFFGLCMLLHIGAGFKWKSWTYTIFLTIGCLAECIGYVGRILLNGNPWSNAGFEMQICCLILAPAFLAAGIYLTLKHVVIDFGPEYSLLAPKYYTWIFIVCDFLSLIMQAIGGALAATSNENLTQLNAGSNIMLSGIVWQVFTLLVFASLVGVYFQRVYVNRANLSEHALALVNDLRFRLFATAIFIAFLTIFIRCVYRIPELALGWGSSIMQNETEFIIFDGLMCIIAAVCLTAFHPGFAYKSMQEHRQSMETTKINASLSESDLEKST